METPRKILVPVDFSRGSLRALDYATSLGSRLPKAEILLLHVVEPMVFPVKPPGVAGPSRSDAWRRKVEGQLDELALETRSKNRLRVRTFIRSGRAFQEIARAAESSKADLIVLGSAGYTADSYSEFGTTAERVARKAPCAVLLVRDKARASR